LKKELYISSHGRNISLILEIQIYPSLSAAKAEYHCSPQCDDLPNVLILVDSNLFIFQYTRKATWKNHSLA
jgi:hypothetical protein